ncbi:MAG: hypothetical protein IT518_08085 [Burkholderiales bacterium]|nr:hypothetical protein [Burkholderiales bacterium]
MTKFMTESGWARAAGVPKETLSRLKKQPSCDLRTLGALARAAGFDLVAVPAGQRSAEPMPGSLTRDYESELLDLAASGNMDPDAWRTHGCSFFMGGLATMLGSAAGFEREKYLWLAESLHPGVTTPEVFALWLRRSPVRASRFLPMAKRRKRRT